MKINIPLTNLILSLYSDYIYNKNQYKHFCNRMEEYQEGEKYYDISGSFIHGAAIQGKFETEMNINKCEGYLSTLLTMHDNWNNIDPEVEEIKQKFYGERDE